MAKHKFGNPFETRRRWVNTAATALRVSRQRAASTQRREVQLNAGINFNRNNSLTLSVTVRKLLVSSAGVSRLYMWARLFDWPQLSTRSARDALYGLTARSIIPVLFFLSSSFKFLFFFNSFLSLLMESNHPETVWPPAEYPVPPAKQCAPTTIHTCIG